MHRIEMHLARRSHRLVHIPGMPTSRSRDGRDDSDGGEPQVRSRRRRLARGRSAARVAQWFTDHGERGSRSRFSSRARDRAFPARASTRSATASTPRAFARIDRHAAGRRRGRVSRASTRPRIVRCASRRTRRGLIARLRPSRRARAGWVRGSPGTERFRASIFAGACDDQLRAGRATRGEQRIRATSASSLIASLRGNRRAASRRRSRRRACASSRVGIDPHNDARDIPLQLARRTLRDDDARTSTASARSAFA